MTLTPALAGAATAAVLLSSGMTVASLSQVGRTCADVRTELESANTLNQDAMEKLDHVWLLARRDATVSAQVNEARQRSEQTKRDLDAVRAEAAALCP